MKYLLLLIAVLFSTTLLSQGLLVKHIDSLRKAHVFDKPTQRLYDKNKVASGIRVGYSEFLVMDLDGNTLYLEKVEWHPNVMLSDSSTPIVPEMAFYRGTDKYKNVAAVMITKTNGAEGTLYAKSGNINFGMAKSGYMVLNDLLLKNDKPEFNCDYKMLPNQQMPKGLSKSELAAAPQGLVTKCVNWYWETDYDVFVNKGSVANATTFIMNIWNQDAMLYANDGMTINLKTLYIWNTPDPYTGASTGNFLTQFGASSQFVTAPTGSLGDLAHLIGFNGGGGIAWTQSLCMGDIMGKSYLMCYSGISTGFATVPTFSWTVEVMAHEEGHVIGSAHTHDCCWLVNGIPNQRIDSCGDFSGYRSCNPAITPPIRLPIGGGTIMSYCHLTSAGINFNKGFGQQVVDLMKKNIFNCTCCGTCSTTGVNKKPKANAGADRVITLPKDSIFVMATAIDSDGIILMYQWRFLSGAVTPLFGLATANNTTVTGFNVAGDYFLEVGAKDDQNGWGYDTLKVTVLQGSCTIPAQPTSISGNINVEQGSTNVYSINAVTGATGYVWSIPPTWSGTSNGTSITVNVGSTGTIGVKSVNACGSSSFQNLSVNTYVIPPTEDTCINPYRTITITTIDQKTNELKVNWTGGTNVKYAYELNGIKMYRIVDTLISGVIVKSFLAPISKAWGSQLLSHTLYTIGNRLRAIVWMIPPKGQCVIYGNKEITITK